ncbi:MAG TPA: RNA polymerase sigma factor [Candidatus Acidoferrales bacterium]|nr:RNA polymerase sigma factor [Candidatus Acidoferrales bacterium]
MALDYGTGLPQQHIEREVVLLYEQHALVLLRYASSIADSGESARDAVQEAFLRYFVERRYGREILNPRAWLYQVLRNYLCDRMNTAAAQREVPAVNLDHVPDEKSDPEAMAAKCQTARAIAASLSHRELECLQLRTEGLSYEEIGSAMAVRIGTVGALLARAHDKIRRRAELVGDQDLSLAGAVYQLLYNEKMCLPG